MNQGQFQYNDSIFLCMCVGDKDIIIVSPSNLCKGTPYIGKKVFCGETVPKPIPRLNSHIHRTCDFASFHNSELKYHRASECFAMACKDRCWLLVFVTCRLEFPHSAYCLAIISLNMGLCEIVHNTTHSIPQWLCTRFTSILFWCVLLMF